MAIPERWRQHIEAWQTSGLTQAAYCRQHRLNANTFSGRLSNYRAASAGPAPELIPIQLEVPPAAPSATTLVVHLGADLQLDIPVTVSPRWLADFLRCLR